MIARRVLLCAVGILASGAPAGAARPPAGTVLLTLTGRISRPNSGTAARYDLAALDRLEQGNFEGDTPWTENPTRFTGPLLSAILNDVGATGNNLEVTAVNDYMAVIPADDARRMNVILATRHDGRPMSVRELGPLWIIYPMDKDPDLRTQAIYAKSVWQVIHITVR